MTKQFYKVQPAPLAITRDGALMSHQGTADELNALRVAATMMRDAIQHEIDNGRMPNMLQGVGIGFVDDVLEGRYVK